MSTEYRTCCLFCSSYVQALTERCSIISLFVLVLCFLSCTYFIAPFCLFLSLYVSFFPSLLSLSILCFFALFFVMPLICFSPCFAYFIHPPSQSLPSSVFSFIYLIFFHHLILVRSYSFFVSVLSFEVFLPIFSFCLPSGLFLFLYFSLPFSFPSYLTLSCAVHCSMRCFCWCDSIF